VYPIRVRFHGIRDFRPTTMDLGSAEANVLVGGRNGSGKSTIVYAMAFAMASSNTNLWSLRSKNLGQTQPWDGEVGILFHNPVGTQQKDAPEYVECIARVTATDTNRYNVKYILQGGNHPQHMDRLRTFSTRREAEEYYRMVFNIDADGYFMFWYQGTITDFTNINDAERFQRVSEMFGIDQYELEWKRALEALTEGEWDLEQSKRQKLNNDRLLRSFEKDRNDLLTRNRIRDEAITGIYRATEIYCGILGERSDKLALQKEELATELEEISRELEACELGLRDIELKKDGLLNRKALIRENMGVADSVIKRLELALEKHRKERDKLASEVEEIREEIKRVRPKDRLNSLKGALQERLLYLDTAIQDCSSQISEEDKEREEILRESGRLGGELNRLKNDIKEKTKLDGDLPPIEDILQDLEGYRAELQGTIQSLVRDKEQKKKLEQRLEQLGKNKTLLLKGQEQLVEAFRGMDIEAAAFGEIFDVAQEPMRQEIEEILGPIKHTVFVLNNPSDKVEEGGFYVVPVEEFMDCTGSGELLKYIIIPESIKKDYSSGFLQGARNWVSLIGFNKADDMKGLAVIDGVLLDRYGARGAIQKEPAIGTKALEIEKEKIQSQIRILISRINACSRDKAELEELIKELEKDKDLREDVDRNLPGLKESLKEAEDTYHQLLKEYEDTINVLKSLEKELKSMEREKDKHDNDLVQVNDELEIHHKHEQQAQKIVRLDELNETIQQQEYRHRSETDKRNRYIRESEEIDKNLQLIEEDIRHLNGQLRHLTSSKKDLDERKGKAEGEWKDLELHIKELEHGLQQVKTEFVAMYDKILDKELSIDLVVDKETISTQYLERRLKDFYDELQDARNRNVLENAEERYNTFLKIYNESAKQLEEAELRFRQLKKDEENRRDDLSKMINKRHADTNRLFKQYMAMLGLEGEIKNIPPEEGKSKDSYKWEIMVATREGHRLEKVERETMRRGKRGSGISGGERAATSLMFALSLLSQIDIKPPFYVLDEFDSALDEGRKHSILDLYSEVLQKKLIIISPKIHGKDYLDRFGKFHCVYSNPDIEKNREISEVYEITRQEYEEEDLEA
jgi:chromosome segregation ATPase